jgi:hypothetical protein
LIDKRDARLLPAPIRVKAKQGSSTLPPLLSRIGRAASIICCGRPLRSLFCNTCYTTEWSKVLQV